MYALLKTLVKQIMRRRDIWFLTFFSSLLLFSITLLITHGSLLEELASIKFLVETISSSQPAAAQNVPADILRNHLGNSSFLILHLFSLVALLLLFIGNPLDNNTILIPIASTPVTRFQLLSTEIFSNILSLTFYLLFPLLLVTVNSILITVPPAQLVLAIFWLILKLCLLGCLFVFIREFSGAVLAGVFSPLLYFLAHFGAIFAKLANRLAFPWQLGARFLQIILPPLHRTGFYSFYIYRSEPLLFALDFIIIICFLILLITGGFLRYNNRDLV